MKTAAEFGQVWGDDIFHMPGTEGTGEYIVVLVTDRGRVGYRNYAGGKYRVRVEPVSDGVTGVLNKNFPQASAGLPKPGAPRRLTWKRPGDQGQNRFSTEVRSAEELKRALTTAIAAVLGGGSDCILSPKPECPDWAKELVGVCGGTPARAGQPESEASRRSRKIANLREWKVPGSNGATRWKTATIDAKHMEKLLELAWDHILSAPIE